MPDWLVIGLGNPGPQYLLSRHNVGFLIVDSFASSHDLSWRREPLAEVAEGEIGPHKVILAKPLTFMNRSGDAVRWLLERSGVPLQRLLVVHDDIDLPFGRLRIRRGGGHGGHHGVESVMEAVGTEFPRLKVGIGRPCNKEEVVAYVLSPFDEEERESLPEVVNKALDALETVLSNGIEEAMNRFNRPL